MKKRYKKIMDQGMKHWLKNRINAEEEVDSQVEVEIPDFLTFKELPNDRCVWWSIIEEEKKIELLSKSIQHLIMDELRKATCNSAYSSDPINGVLLGHIEYAALKKSIEDGNTLRFDMPYHTDNIVFNGLIVLEVNKPGITIAKLYNT